MSARLVRGLLASLVLLLLISVPQAFTASAEIQSQPYIEYTDKNGLKLSVNRGSIAALKSPKFQWFVGGKAVARATKVSFSATAKQKNKSIQVKISAGGITTASVVGTIGQVIVNVKPTAMYVDETQNKVTVKPGRVSPASAKVVYQWYKGPIDIPNAKSVNYTAATSDQGFKIYVNARYSAKGFREVTSD